MDAKASACCGAAGGAREAARQWLLGLVGEERWWLESYALSRASVCGEDSHAARL